MTEHINRKKACVFFDLDDTLFDFKKAERIAIGKAFKEVGIEASPGIIDRYSEINVGRWQLMELGLISRNEVLLGRFTQLFSEIGADASPERTNDLYEHFLSKGHYFMPGAEELIHELYGEYRLFICSNGTAIVQSGRIESAGIEKFFEKIFVSEKIGFNKPSKEYFERCFSEIDGFDHSRAIIIGDSLSSDIKGGLTAGIKTCWYNPMKRTGREDIIPDHTVSDLCEIPELLDSFF